jgi:hypothetical protein
MDSGTEIAAAKSASPLSGASEVRHGIVLVFGAAMVWSFGGAIARELDVGDPGRLLPGARSSPPCS